MIAGACFYATVVGSVAVLVKNADMQVRNPIKLSADSPDKTIN
jgi:hypothetical protein